MSKAELIVENEKLKARVAELEAVLKDALAQLEARKRAGKRQAAPFSRGEKKIQPKRPGRQKGHPPSHRAIPPKVDQELDAPLKQRNCLYCGGDLSEPTYAQLIFSLRQQQVVWADETGWNINGDHTWLWVFTAEQLTWPNASWAVILRAC